MASSLYRNQKNSINIPTVELTTTHRKTGLDMAPFLADMANGIGKLAEDNFVLGTAQASFDVVQSAYDAAPNDPKKFGELFDAGYNKIASKLPIGMRMEFDKRLLPLKQQYMAKTVTNKKTKEDNTRTKLIEDNFNSTKRAYEDATNSLFAAQQRGDADEIRIATESYANIKGRLNTLVNTTNSDGKALFDKTTREQVETGSFLKIDSFKNNIDNLTYEQLEAFDNDVFQNGEKYMRDTNIDRSTYDSMNAYVKQRRKALNDEDKRITRSQAYYAAGQQLQDFNADTYKELVKSGEIPKGALDDIAKLNKEKIPADYRYNPNKATDANILMESIKTANNIIKTGDVDAGLTALIEANQRIAAYGTQHNVPSDKILQMQNMNNRVYLDKNFADIMVPMTAHSSIFEKANMPARLKALEGRDVPDMSGAINFTPEKRRAVANIQERMLATMVTAKAQGATADELDMIAAQAERHAVKTYYSDIADWNLLEKQKAAGEPALFRYNGRNWKFNGYGADTIFMELAE